MRKVKALSGQICEFFSECLFVSCLNGIWNNYEILHAPEYTYTIPLLSIVIYSNPLSHRLREEAKYIPQRGTWPHFERETTSQ